MITLSQSDFVTWKDYRSQWVWKEWNSLPPFRHSRQLFARTPGIYWSDCLTQCHFSVGSVEVGRTPFLSRSNLLLSELLFKDPNERRWWTASSNILQIRRTSSRFSWRVDQKIEERQTKYRYSDERFRVNRLFSKDNQSAHNQKKVEWEDAFAQV